MFQSRNHKLTMLWDRVLNIPRSQLRICMFLLQNGNKMQKRKLIDALLSEKVKYSDSKHYCYIAVERAIKNHILTEDKAGFVSVEEPVCFIFKIVRGDVLDNWKVIILPTLILAILFATINPTITILLGLASLGVVVLWFIEDWINTLKF